MNDPSLAPGNGAAMYLRLGAAEADVAQRVSTLRQAALILLALLVAIAMPLYWAGTALAGSDEPAAPLNNKGASAADDDDDDDDETGDDTGGADTTDGNGRSDGANDTRGTDGAGDTRGTALTDQGPDTVKG